jgi:uncharacterized peroxidase-related enzyme
MGFAPNLVRVLANAPAAAHAYLDLGARFRETSLSPVEQQVVLLAVSFANGCDYCMAAHSTAAVRVGVGAEDLAALRDGTALADERLDALRDLTRALVEDRGRVPDGTLQRFLDAGYSRTNVLEVLLGVAMKTLSNYTNHVADTPLDDVFEAQRWAPSTGVAHG